MTTDITKKLIISVAGEDEILDFESFGLTFDSTESEILTAIAPFISEKYSVDFRSPEGSWLYKTRKATSSQNIHIIPNSTAGSSSEHALSYLDDATRLNAYNLITNGCMHIWSKNKLQEDKLNEVLSTFSELAEKDPLFLAHFTSYIHRKLDSKDLKVISTFVSSLSDADGSPFSPGSEYHKPNWRIVSQAALQQLDPKLVVRVLKLANAKRAFGSKPQATHFSKTLKTAAKKYIKYREQNPKALEGIKKAGLTNTMKALYRITKTLPSKEAVQTLGWKQKKNYPNSDVAITKSTFDFSNLTDLQIAEKIQKENLKPTAVLGALPNKLSPVIAAAILEQSSGDQAVILTEMFEQQGLLKDPQVKSLYETKLKSAKHTLDRVDHIKTKLTQETEESLKNAKADSRKQSVGNIGKLFLHIDVSGSMDAALNIATEKGAILAECVQNPQDNFYWGLFNERGMILPKPTKFTKDAFTASLYGIRAGGGTDCLALYEEARKLGCDTDVFVTDEQHTQGSIKPRIEMLRRKYPDPKQVVIIKVGRYSNDLSNQFKECGIPVSILDPNQLTESALVTQAVKSAIRGTSAILDEIMNEPLLELPKWWFATGT